MIQTTEAERQAAVRELQRRGYVYKTTLTLVSPKGQKLFEATWRAAVSQCVQIIAVREKAALKGEAGEVRIESWIDADVRNRLVAGCKRSGVTISRAIEMMVNDTFPAVGGDDTFGTKDFRSRHAAMIDAILNDGEGE